MNTLYKNTALLVGLTSFLLPNMALALVSQFVDTFSETANSCVTTTDRMCDALVLSNISQVRGTSEGEQYDFEMATFAASVADEWEDTLPIAVCARLSNALVLISKSTETASLATNIVNLAEVVGECEGIGVIADEILASPN